MTPKQKELFAYHPASYMNDSNSLCTTEITEESPLTHCEWVAKEFENINQGHYAPHLSMQLHLTSCPPFEDDDLVSVSQSHNFLPTKIPLLDLFLLDPLLGKTHTIIATLRDVVLTKLRSGQRLWSSVTEELCLKLFSPAQIRYFLDLFWSLWYPNCPIIHKPTFNIEQVPAELLCPMVVLGACTSRDTSHRKIAGFWFDIVEELVFTSPLLEEDTTKPYSPKRNAPVSRKRLQVLQGAYCVCLYQNWEGPDRAKRRIRNQRFSVLVTVIISLFAFLE
jgi:hypothetical protein